MQNNQKPRTLIEVLQAEKQKQNEKNEESFEDFWNTTNINTHIMEVLEMNTKRKGQNVYLKQ